MVLIIFLFIITQCGAVDLDFLKIVLSGNLKEIDNLNNPREAIIESKDVLKKIDLSNHEKKVIWGAFKGENGPQDLTADDLGNITDLLHIIPEDELCHLNLTDWSIVEILGKVDTFSRSQVSVLTNALKIKHGLNLLTRADSVNKLSSLICGFSEDELSKIPRHDFRKIKSQVFAKLSACSDSQLKVLHDKLINIYGVPRTWRPHLLKHIGMVILSLDKSEIQTLRPLSLLSLDLDMLKKHKPDLLDAFTPEQLKALTMHMVTNHTLNSSSHSSELEELFFFISLVLRAYLLLKF